MKTRLYVGVLAVAAVLLGGMKFKDVTEEAYRNLGNGEFEDITAEAGIKSDAWSITFGWLDYDSAHY